MLHGSYPHASGDPAEDECVGFYGVSKGKSSLMLYEQDQGGSGAEGTTPTRWLRTRHGEGRYPQHADFYDRTSEP